MKTNHQHLFDPGASRVYFSKGFSKGLPPPKKDLHFCTDTALWLAELSRVVYRKQHDVEPTRTEILKRVGLMEHQVCQTTTLLASLIRPCDRDDVGFLVFRGTQDLKNWLTNVQFTLCSWNKGMMVHEGFKQAFDALEPQLSRALSAFKGAVYYTGHSLGGALATLAASHFSPSALYTFGAPRVGNPAFNASVNGIPWFRVCNARDIVCNVPPPLPLVGFMHGGIPVYITQAGKLEIGANAWSIAVDQWQLEWLAKSDQNMKDMMELPSVLTDHAPLNYVRQLARITHNE